MDKDIDTFSKYVYDANAGLEKPNALHTRIIWTIKFPVHLNMHNDKLGCILRKILSSLSLEVF